MACSSTSAKSPSGRKPASQKMTNDDSHPDDLLPIVTSRVFYSPRRFEELESAILLNKGVQSCLTSGGALAVAPLSIDIEGRISYTGQTEVVSIDVSDLLVKNCLLGALPQIKHGRGIQGPFKMRLERSIGPANGKGLILKPDAVKKFE